MRNSFRYASKADWEKLAQDVQPIYTAPTEQAARDRLADLDARWGQCYPAINRLWQWAWPTEFVPFLAYSPEIWTVTYSTNAIDSRSRRRRDSASTREAR